MIFGPDGRTRAREWLGEGRRIVAPCARRNVSGPNRRGQSGGGPRGVGGGVVPSWTPAIVPVAQRLFWYRDEITIGAAPNITAWIDKWAAWGNTTAPGNDPDDVASTFFKRGRAVQFDEAGGPTEYFQAGGTLAQQRAIHFPGAQGTCIGFVGRCTKDADSTQTPCGNFAEAAATNGFSIRQDTANAASNRMLVSIGNGGGTLIVDVGTAIGSTPFDRTYAFVLAVRDHASEDDYELWFGSTVDAMTRVVSGTFVAAPNNADAASQMRIGARGGAISWYFTGQLSEMVGIADFNAAPQLANYLQQEIAS